VGEAVRVQVLPLAGAVFGGPALGGAEVEHLLASSADFVMGRLGFEGRGEEGKDLGGDDVEAGLFPVAVGLFEGVDLWGLRVRNGFCALGGVSRSLTSFSVHTLIRSRSRLRRICRAGTW